MNARKELFRAIIDGAKQFVIPVFQRDYSWTSEQCTQLWDDLLRNRGAADDGHFLGSFVYVEGSTRTTFSRWLVIDGQQRLTTLTLLLVALRDHIEETEWAGEEPNTEQINAYYLKNEKEKNERCYKLALRRQDDATLRALVDGKDHSDLENRSELIVEAYNHFRNLLNSGQADPEEIYRGIGSLRIVDVKLERPVDNPQLVFESLNSTGVDLTQSDLIRNYLLMGLPETEQTSLYNDYWSKLESHFHKAGTAPDSFLRDYIALKRKSTTQIRADRIYAEFKDFWQPSDSKRLAGLLRDLVRFARYYVSFLRPDQIDSKPLATALRQVGLGSAHALLVMRLFEYYENNALNHNNFIRALNLIASYIVRRAVLGMQTRGYWSVFARIAQSISDESPFESFQVALARQNYSFPSDGSFEKEIQERDLFSLRICWYILTELENAGYNEPSPTGTYTIEHIMPQDIDRVREWQEMLGDDWKEVHQTWLHRVGNLTLTAYNSSYKNRPFEEKKTVEGGLNRSSVRLNEYVRNQTQWTKTQMQERGQLLAKRALIIWPNHEADEKAILDDKIRELGVRANERNSDSLKMKDHTRQLLHAFQNSLRVLGDFLEVIENKSVCYYDYSARFFLELLPMAYSVRLLMPLEFDDLHDPNGLVRDATAWKILPNVKHRDCGVLIDIREQPQIPAAMQVVRQAFSMAGN